MDGESSGTDDDTSSDSSVVSMPAKKRKKISNGVGVVGTSSHNIAVSTQEKREKISNGVVATQEKRSEKVTKGVGAVHSSSCNTVISTQERNREIVSKGTGAGVGVGVVDSSSRAVVSTQGKKRREFSNGVEVKVSQQLDILLDAVAKKSFNGKDKPGCSIEEVMQIVDGMPEIAEDDELFLKAADILTDRQNREMFIALKQRNRQIMWLKHKKV